MQDEVLPTQKRYTQEFKQEAVRLYESGVYGGMERTAKALGVGTTAFRRWVQASTSDADGTPAGAADASAEISELRREVAKLREEREILRKATAFFVRETDRIG